MLSGRGLCDELITRPEESYRLCCVVVCDLETSRIGAPYIYDISSLRVNENLFNYIKTTNRLHLEAFKDGRIRSVATSVAKAFRSGTGKTRSGNFENNVTKTPGLKTLTIKSPTKQRLSSDTPFFVYNKECEFTYIVMPVVVINVFGTDSSGIATFYQICLCL